MGIMAYWGWFEFSFRNVQGATEVRQGKLCEVWKKSSLMRENQCFIKVHIHSYLSNQHRMIGHYY